MGKIIRQGKMSIALTILLFIFLPGCVLQASSVPMGWLHTKGTAILDRENRLVILRGMNNSGMEYGVGNPWEPVAGGGFRCEDKLQHGCWASPEQSRYGNRAYGDAAGWGFNVVRIPIAWANLEPSPPTVENGKVEHHFNRAYESVLDEMISRYGSMGISVILSMHQANWSPAYNGVGLPVWLYAKDKPVDISHAKYDFFTDKTDGGRSLDEFVAAWREIAARYANDPTVVGADVFNEPNLKNCSGNCRSTVTGQVYLDKFYEQVGGVIRQTNPHLLLIFQDGPGTPITPALWGHFNNAVYSFHFYPSEWSGGKTWLSAKVSEGQTWQVPIWVGEFARFGKKGLWPQNLKAFLGYTAQAKIGWAYWDYLRSGYPLDPQAPGRKQTASEQGRLVKIIACAAQNYPC